jgi:predicted amidohydrolase YtcJ
MIEAGAKMTFGSDWPVAPMDPIAGIYAAVTRRTLDDRNPGGWFPAEKITVEEALRAYTVRNAYASFQENRLGILRKGMLADLVVLSGDLFSIAPEKIREIQVTRTVVNGKEVYVK